MTILGRGTIHKYKNVTRITDFRKKKCFKCTLLRACSKKGLKGLILFVVYGAVKVKS